jgi:protein-tyrosine kinase
VIIEPALEKILHDATVPVTAQDEPALEKILHDATVPVTAQDSGESPPVSAGSSRADNATDAVGVGARGHALHLDLEWLASVGITYSVEQEVTKRREYRVVCRQLLTNLERPGDKLLNAGRRLVGVTSALPGEGKTYTSFNIARSIAELNDLPVILVDADLVRRTLSVVCEATDCAGVAEFLGGEVSDLESLIRPTNIPRLAILPCGKAEGEGHALMSPSRLQKLAAELSAKGNAAIVVIDCPPVLANEDAAQLTGIVNRVVFVVRAAATLVDSVCGAIERLEAADKVVLLLNGWAPAHIDYEFAGKSQSSKKP